MHTEDRYESLSRQRSVTDLTVARVGDDVRVKVSKRTYCPAGWKFLRERTMRVERATKKRVYLGKGVGALIFDRATARHVQTIDDRIYSSYGYDIV